MPKNFNLAKQWNRAIGIDPDKQITGYVCIKHFPDDCLANYKSQTRLKSGAVPQILLCQENQESDSFNTLDKNKKSDKNTKKTTVKKVKNKKKNEEILELREKLCEMNLRLESLQEENENQKKQIKKLQNKSYYLENVKLKLRNCIAEMKKDKLISEEISKALEVFQNIFHFFGNSNN